MAQFGMGYGDGYSRKQMVYDDELDPIGPQRGDGSQQQQQGGGQQNGTGHTHLLGAYNNKYRDLIDLVDHLRGFGLERELPLPQVAVLGVQTSGKSSVLEGISGVQLPRGTGIVTRCPIELRLKSSEDQHAPWRGKVTCENDKGERMEVDLSSPNEVANTILRAQQFLAGEHDISTRRVILEVVSSYVPDLTLVDMPGLVEVAMENQPHDVVEKVQRIVSHYINKKETIIMVVIPCTMEIATTKALKMALEADQDGTRTLGVLTKPDLVDKGAEEDIIGMVRSPERFQIRKGFTVVKLRSKEEITNGVSLPQALHLEQQWFDKSPQFRQLPKYVVGTKSLARKLTHELVDRIKTVLPCLKADVHMKMKEVEENLEALGRGIPDDQDDRRQLLTDLLNDFTEKITRICEGLYDRKVPTNQRLLIWTRPHMEDFATVVAELMPDESNTFLRERIEREIREQRGMELPGFLSYMACKNIIQRLLDGYIPPARDCLHKVNSVVEEFLRKVAEEKFAAYPGLMTQVKGLVDEIQQTQLNGCGKALEELFEIEMMVVIPDVLFYKGSARAARYSDNDSETTSMAGFDDAVMAPGPGDVPSDYPKQQQRGWGLGRRKEKGRAPRSVTPTPEKSTWHAEAQKGAAGDNFSEKSATLGPQSAPPVYIPAAENETKENAHFTLDRITIYFRTALERLMGSIPARIHYHLIHRLSLDVKSRVTNLGTDASTLENLIEDEKTATIRVELVERQECLRKSLDELNKF